MNKTTTTIIIAIVLAGVVGGITAASIFWMMPAKKVGFAFPERPEEEQQRGRVEITEKIIKLYDDVAELYCLHTRTVPAKLEDLVTEPAGVNGWDGPYLANEILQDPWDNDFQYEAIEGRTWIITSAGPDGKFGTDDDLKSKGDK